jgi:hypothetical protein
MQYQQDYIFLVWSVFIGGIWQVSTLLPIIKTAFHILDRAMLRGERVLLGRR